MGRKAKTEAGPKCCDKSINLSIDNCRVEALVSVDDRGQMVLPKELRAKAGIQPGEKLAIVSWSDERGVYCLTLMKADALTGYVQKILGPMVGELRQEKKE